MKTGFKGTFVISWSQTEVDGLKAASHEALVAGAIWSWTGEAVRVDGPDDLLQLERADGDRDLRRRAARSVRRLVGAAVPELAREAVVSQAVAPTEPLREKCFVVSNGTDSFTATLIEIGKARMPLLMFLDSLPPAGCDLWIVQPLQLDTPRNLRHAGLGQEEPATRGVICFTPGTRISTPQGPRLIEALKEGDLVQTRDNGAQRIRWIGARRMSGARLFAMPDLRPVRIRAGALGIDRPEEELLVSPDHRMLLRGDRVRDLFNTVEVLVAARDLVNGRSIVRDASERQVTYIHLLFDRHEVLWANGVPSESFHPAHAATELLDPLCRARLQRVLPKFEHDPESYGQFARRNLSDAEAAILLHLAA